MNHEMELRIQSYLDDELSEAAARELADLLRTDPRASEVFEELDATARLLKANEPEYRVPEGRDFYWAKIQDRIAHDPTRINRSNSVLAPWWRGFLLPVSGAVAVFVMLIASLRSGSELPGRGATSFLHEIESPMAEASAFAFHSRASGMTVIWVASRGK